MALIAGEPGLGKSALTAFMAAKISCGGDLPGVSQPAPVGAVLIASPEDDPERTLLPRLKAAGADIRSVHIVRDPLDLHRDFERFEADALAIENLRLIILDPLTAFLGGMDPNRAGPARLLMGRLTDLAQRTGCAVVGVMHLSKMRAARNPMTAVAGSNAFVAAARAAHLVCLDPKDPDRRLLLPFKNNLHRLGAGLAFRLETVVVEGSISAPKVVFENTPVELTAIEALRAAAGSPEHSSALEDAKDFLAASLAGGPMDVKSLFDDAGGAGIARATLRRAKQVLGIRSKKTGVNGWWEWELPAGAKVLKQAEDAQGGDMSTFGVDEHLRDELTYGSGAEEQG